MSRSESHLLLINPWIYDFAAYDYWLKPLGLLGIAALLRQNGFDVSFIDCLDRHHPLMLSKTGVKRLRSDEKYGHGQFFKEEIQKPRSLNSVPRRYSRYGIHPNIFYQELKDLKPPPKAILITTMMTYWYPGTARILEILRDIFPDTPVILGGNYVTLCPQHAKALGADYYIYGHGTKQLLRILNQITGQPIICMPDEGFMDYLPYPAFDLLNRLDYVCIQTCVGCPFKCSYCASYLLDPEFKRASPERIADQIEYWYKNYCVKNIVFYDDALLFEPEAHIIPIIKEIIKRGLNNIYFHAPNGLHAKFITPTLAQLMFKSGFKTIRLGYETSDPHKQSITGGKVYDGELEAALSYLQEAGFRPSDLGVYIMIGMPGQEAEEVEETIQRTVAFGGIPVLTEFSPIPGTAIWEESLQYSSYPLANDPIFHNNSILPCEWIGFSWKDYLRIKSMVNEIRRQINKKWH